VVLYSHPRQAIEKRLIKVHRPSVNEGGKALEGALKGMQAMRDGKVSGKKLGSNRRICHLNIASSRASCAIVTVYTSKCM
jgi:hypothetical protein